jgi:hypothetical protein
MARPGMAVEAGGLVARLVDFHRPLVRLDLPPDGLVAGPPAQVELVAAPPAPPALNAVNSIDTAAQAATVVATLAGPAPQVDVPSQFASYWYEARLNATEGNGPAATAGTNGVSRGGVSWRPGLFVQASLQVIGAKPQQVVSVPRTAVLFHQGRPLAYVRIAPGRFERREVRLLGQGDGRWVLAAGVAAGEPVVYRQAQVLLSEEFRGDVDAD